MSHIKSRLKEITLKKWNDDGINLKNKTDILSRKIIRTEMRSYKSGEKFALLYERQQWGQIYSMSLFVCV